MLRMTIASLGAAALLVAAAHATGWQQPPAGEQVHQSSLGDFTLSVPEDWFAREVEVEHVRWMLRDDFQSTQTILLTRSPEANRAFNVVVEHVPEGMGLEQYVAANLEQLPEVFQGFEQHSHTRTTLGAAPADMVVYSAGEEAERFTALVYLTVRERRGYTITAIAPPAQFEASRPLFTRAAETFRFTPITAP